MESFAQVVHPFATLEGDFASGEDTYLVSAKLREGLSEMTQARIVFATKATAVKLEDLVGKKYTLKIKTSQENDRYFHGHCIEAEFLGRAERYDLFAIETRTWNWFLTQTRNTRIFQEKSIPDIIKEVCSDLGFDDVELKLTGSYPACTYVVQYDETDWDFICRRAEELGIYWYVIYDGQNDKLVLADGAGAHMPIEETPKLEYHPESQKGKVREDTVFAWDEKLKFVPGKVSLVDYDLTKPKTKLSVTQIKKRGSHSRNDLEVYQMAGRYATVSEGESLARVAAERQAHGYEHFTGSTDVRTIAPGATFELKEHPRLEGEKEFLVVRAEHYWQIERLKRDAGELEKLIVDRGFQFPDFAEHYLCKFEVMRKSEPYRPPAVTPWPDLSGLHSAVVTGPSGEEIYTDEYGRVKVQFHWDRDGQNNESTTCWVRSLHPWVGKGYGMQWIPRIGQEVIIMFERNNPDRPYIIGSVYNGVNMPPYALPGNMTQTGIKTESSKGGGGFNEFVMEDKKGEEFVRLQSEKDYKEIIKNNAEITIGLEKADPGDMSLTVHHDLTEMIKTGDHTYTVDAGNQTNTIEGNQTTTIRTGNQNTSIDTGNQSTTIKKGDQTLKIDKGKQSNTIQGNQTTTLKQGSQTTNIKMGNQTTTLNMGNQTTNIKMGNQKTKVALGKTTHEAMQSYEIKVGMSSIKLTPTSIQIKSPMIEINGQIMTTVKAGVSLELKGTAMATLKGGIVGIN